MTIVNPNFNFDHLREISQEASAEDKKGTFTAGIFILMVAICLSGLSYTITLSIFPNNLFNFLEAKKAELNAKYNTKKEKTEEEEEKKKDPLDYALQVLKYAVTFGPIILGVGAMGFIIIKERRKARKKRQMEEAMAAEMSEIKKNLQKEIEEINASGGDEANEKVPSALNGTTIVQIFNNFAAIMGLQSNIRRNKEETALEYFKKISESLRFPESESLKAAKYFDDELYGKKNSTKSDRAAFMKLLLEIMNKINPNLAEKNKMAA